MVKQLLIGGWFRILARIPLSLRQGMQGTLPHRGYVALRRRLTRGASEGVYEILAGPLRGSSIVVNPDSYNSRYLLGSHEPEVAGALASLVRPGMVVADVGAHYGYFTLLMAKLVGPGGQVFAVEPLPQNADRIRSSLAVNGIANAEVCQMALASTDGTEDLLIMREDMMGRVRGTVIGDHEPSMDAVEVPIRRLDTWTSHQGIDRLDLVKLDVEGAEDAFLDGAAASLRRYRPIMVVEVHTFEPVETHARPFVRRLGELGYRVSALETGQAVDVDRFQGGHVIAVPNGSSPPLERAIGPSGEDVMPDRRPGSPAAS